jgi:hypothetical protein
MGDMSLEAISEIFGFRTHSPPQHGLKTIDFEINTYSDVRDDYKKIRGILKSDSDQLDNKDIYRHLAFNLFMFHPQGLIDSGISLNDIKILAKDFRVTAQYEQNVIDMYDKSKKKDDKIDKVIKKDFGNDNKENKIKNVTDGEKADKIRK